ncbi:hypothetical protein BDV95DRAFT_129563 [Massariosphaeria phaeospora]|uniref:DH domain-containing protein n=1 Tax=Massariosphaeria phaeospora TaxID=100035 RepID=A0A7C8I9F1_9PLEO|nr:hypothetical protein BDV95DRAFT_129563 [Massariosphaeria phaeospora]
MEAVAAAFGIVASIPQIVQSAKDLYDLREVYKNASVLITAIYAESMVIAASLSQVQRLLQQDALQNNPQLLETFDRALTGIRIVYGCLEEEVRALPQNAPNGEMRSRDRVKFAVWKDGIFRDLLQQIRGQQSALSFLIQGLQMESLADIKQLVQDNSAKLDQVAKRSNTLRKTHPSIRVPHSVFEEQPDSKDLSDVQSVLNSAEFAFDNEVVNSKAYRRAIALAAAQVQRNDPQRDLIEGDLIDLESVRGVDDDQEPPISETLVDLKSLDIEDASSVMQRDSSWQYQPQDHVSGDVDTQTEFLDSLDRHMLPYMPPGPGISLKSGNVHTPPDALPTSGQEPHRNLVMEEPTVHAPKTPIDVAEIEEAQRSSPSINKRRKTPPPLPPRRANRPETSARPLIASSDIGYSGVADDNASNFSEPSSSSIISTTSSHTFIEPERNDSPGYKELSEASPSLSHTNSYDSFITFAPMSQGLTRTHPTKSVDVLGTWISLIEDEQRFIERMSKLRELFFDPVIRQWPGLEKHLALTPLGEQLASLNRHHLLDPMTNEITTESYDPAVFEVWANNTHTAFGEYCRRIPRARSALRLTHRTDAKFSSFIRGLGLKILYAGKGWEDIICLPLAQLDLYINKLQDLDHPTEVNSTQSRSHQQSGVSHALETVQKLKFYCHHLVSGAESREDIQTLQSRIHGADVGLLSQLNLTHSSRRILFQSRLSMKVHGTGLWHIVHAVILDNFFVWAEINPPGLRKMWDIKRSTENKIWLVDAPISLSSLEVATDQNRPYERTTLLDELPRGSILYTIFIKEHGSSTKSHILGANSPQERNVLYNQLVSVVHGASKPS